MNQVAEKKQGGLTVAQQKRKTWTSIANQLLRDWVGEQRAGEASGRVMNALSASAAGSRQPDQFWKCTNESVGRVIAVSALTGIMPATGATALAYAFPRQVKGKWQLQYELSHRGLNSLAKRSGQTMLAIPISHKDDIVVDEAGEVTIRMRDIDNPPEEWDDLRGVVIMVKQIATGVITFRGWVAKSILAKRREMSDSWKADQKNGTSWSPWTAWPVEQAITKAMHYAVGRGWCTIDDTESARALSLSNTADTIPAVSVKPTTPAGGVAALEHHLGLDEDQESEPEAETEEPPEKEGATGYERCFRAIQTATSKTELIEMAAEIDSDPSLDKGEKEELARIINVQIDKMPD